jgi:hypothetical protein
VTTRTLTSTEREPDEPHDKEDDSGDPQHMKCEPRTEQYEYKQ